MFKKTSLSEFREAHVFDDEKIQIPLGVGALQLGLHNLVSDSTSPAD